MNDEQLMVHDFHQRFGLPCSDHPSWPGETLHRLRVLLIEEELAELRNAGEARNLVAVADALADLLYVVYGAAEAYGIDLEPVFREIHRSNMSKGDPQVVRRPDGKILKGDHYSPPQVAEVVEMQLERTAVPA
jgi:predicted HAD superfamily Cof-like phosphohydrolase